MPRSPGPSGSFQQNWSLLQLIKKTKLRECIYLNTFRVEFVQSKEEEEDDKADGKEDKLEGAPGPADGLLAETDLNARVLPVLEPLVDHEDDVEDGGDEADNHQGVVLLAGGGALADVAKKLK